VSATDFPLLAVDGRSPFSWRALRKTWMARWTTRCAAAECPRHGTLCPYWLRHSSGVFFDGRWYCGRACLESVLVSRVDALLSGFQSGKPRTHRLPLGLLLIHRGAISQAQLREALRRQREAGHGKIGDWLRQTAGLGAQQVTAALGQQWGCPVFPLENQNSCASWSDLIPLPLLESAGAAPAHASADGRALHLAFGERVDHTLLYAAQQMLLCRTFPCVAPEAAVHNRLELMRRFASANYTSFDTVRESSEMAWTICNYAVEVRAQRMALVRATSYIWVRFFGSQSSRDLLFRILPGPQSASRERQWPRAKALSFSADGRKVDVSNASLPS
jgi:Type II secretion system (T2SS), protein E, N-terminal domain